MASGMSKKKLITKILNASKVPTEKRDNLRTAMLEKKMSDLRDLLKKAEGKAAAAPKDEKKPVAGKKKSRKSLPKSMRSRVAKLVAGIKAGRIAVRQGLSKPSDAKGDTARARYENFLSAYKKVSTAKRKKGVSALLERYKAIPQASRMPYYLQAGFFVGGGPNGPGIIRTIPKRYSGVAAMPFSKLDKAGQKKVIAFLNGPGKALRSKGAKKDVKAAVAK